MTTPHTSLRAPLHTTRAGLPIPGLVWGDYPERRPAALGIAERVETGLRGATRHLAEFAAILQRRSDARWLAAVSAARARLDAAPPCDDAVLLQGVRAELLRHGFAPAALAMAFALAARTAQRELGTAPFDTQLIAACTVLGNRLAEMATGEGKTLAVGLAAAVGALAGMPVHVVTANDYLVARDAERLAPFYAALGLRVGCVVHGDAAEARAAAYGCDITYVTAKELVFDYLRDAIGGPAGFGDHDAVGLRRRRDALPAPLARLHAAAAPAALLRGLCMAIVDEADAILIDEARVPLILSQRGAPTEAQAHAVPTVRFARTLREGADFTLDRSSFAATLTDAGRDRLDRAADSLASACASAAWRNRQHREHAVCLALAALHLYEIDRHYLVQGGTVQLIDETTGRVADGRVWSNGLQQLVEAKERCSASPGVVTVAQITYQRFFPRYVRLGGVSGTLAEARTELLATYGVTLRRVPLRRACRRRTGSTRLFATHARLWAAVAERIAQLHAGGQPVLAATDSVAEAQALGRALAACGLPHAELHARDHAHEARIVAEAGQRGAITVTTNMAGRGTDIALGAGVEALGGLHVICCQLSAARRIDRQLAGRAARQGEAGSVETMLSLDTALLADGLPEALRRGLRGIAHRLPSWAVRRLVRWPQRAEEQRLRVQRARLIEHDERSGRQLGFGGAGE